MKTKIDKANLDTPMKPGDDFYGYANGGWMKKNPLTAEYARYGQFDALREKNSTLQGQLSQEHQTLALQNYQAQALAPVNAALADLSARLGKIECNQPEVARIPYVPAAGNYIPVNYGVNVNPFSTLCGC